jgi:hypothetical protein
VSLAVLVPAAILMFAFSPREDAVSSEQTAAVKMMKTESFGTEYVVRVYGAGDSAKPHIFLVPPEIGSAASVDIVCTKLAEKGYTVVTYFRAGYDNPLIDAAGKKLRTSPATLLKQWRIFRKATERASENRMGKISEAERRADIILLLSRLPSLLEIPGHSGLPPMVLAGYGAGGSALAYMAGEEGFASRFNNVLGVIAIESRLWSSYQDKPRHVSEVPASAGAARRFWSAFVNNLYNLPQQRVERTGPLPGSGLPVLYLVSGRALDDGKKHKPYQAVLDTLRSGSGLAALAAIKSAGPLDYQDFPLTHPVYSFFLPGLQGASKSKTPVDNTAGVIGNFASYLLEQARQAGREVSVPPRQTIGDALHIESRGLNAFRL